MNHWYWECDPKWSITDIAIKIGCTINKVNRFMKKHNIPIRNRSEAAKNMHKCPPKRKSFIISHNSIKFKQKQSKLTKECWKDPIKRKIC